MGSDFSTSCWMEPCSRCHYIELNLNNISHTAACLCPSAFQLIALSSSLSHTLSECSNIWKLNRSQNTFTSLWWTHLIIAFNNSFFRLRSQTKGLKCNIKYIWLYFYQMYQRNHGKSARSILAVAILTSYYNEKRDHIKESRNACFSII